MVVNVQSKYLQYSDISTAVVNGDGDWIDQPLRVEDSSSSEFKTLSHINEAIDDEGGNESDDGKYHFSN